MKRVLTTRFAMFFAFLLSLLSCGTDYEDTILVNDNNSQFTISQAKEYFGASFPQTRSSDLVNEFLCMNFIPLWESAKYSRADNIESVDVPIDKKIDFIMRKGRDFVLAPQRLTIIKDNGTGIASSFLTTFIPDAKFLKTNNITAYDPQSFETSGKKGNYSGLVIYTPTNSSEIVLINVYKNGGKVESANILSTDAAENEADAVRIGKLLKGIHVYPSTESCELATANR